MRHYYEEIHRTGRMSGDENHLSLKVAGVDQEVMGDALASGMSRIECGMYSVVAMI
jgi:hypothetical protein